MKNLEGTYQLILAQRLPPKWMRPVRLKRQLLRRRKAIIEHCFGTIKRSFGYDYFLCRGKRAVTTEVYLTVLAYNLKRVCNLVGVPQLIAAVS